MKKINRLIIIVMLFAALILISGCQSNSSTDEPSRGTVPSEYEKIVEDYKKIVEFRISEDFESGNNTGEFAELNEKLKADLSPSLQYKWDNMIADMLDGIETPSMESFGYILKDLNGDGVRELIWASSDYNKIFAVFTVHDGKVELLDAYWSRYRGVVSDSGKLYTLGSGGADTFEYAAVEVDTNEDSGLKVIKRFGCDGGKFYEASGDDDVTIDKTRFDEIFSEYPFEFGEKWADNQIYLP